MSNIIDRRKTNKNKSVGNRQKFIKRYKARIKRSVDNLTSDKGITDVLKDRKITIDQDEIDEPGFEYDLSTGERDIVFTGNKSLQKGDKIYQPPKEDGTDQEGNPNVADSLDEFTFTLTKEEFLNLYFSDLALPNFIKESLVGTPKYKMTRSGYSKEGIPPRLDLVKTLKQAMARRIATGSKRYLDDIDLRYKHFTNKPYPILQATMILLMDVSGSMGEFEKTLAKKFFLLLYLFLEKNYKQVELIFISHTTEATEVSEQEFFYGHQSGGTVVSSGLKLAQEIINTRIDTSITNVYISQASDGDNWPGDDDVTIDVIEDLLSKVQYFAYIQTEEYSRKERKRKQGTTDLMTIYSQLESKHKNFRARHVCSESEVYPVLRELFE